ncbi:MAG: sporulation protein YqfD [Oscillospiraceae bacterium]|nr:sporulation protein YqfD [Oscillospiraceae bacterium]
MFFINLYNFLFGYVTVKIKGAKPERFINMLMNLRIKFWGIEKISENELNFKTASRYARKYVFDEIARKTHTNCEIVSKKGIKFLLERHKYRLGLYTGAVAGFILIYMSTFYIWDIKIDKSDYPNNAEIIELLENLGCKTGAYIPKIDPFELQTKAILANKNIAWIAVNIKGTVAYVEVKKREEPVTIVDQTTPTNVVASKSGKIVYMDAYDGTKVATLDNTVQKGDLLISGAVNSNALGVRIKHAAGKVLAETTRIIEVEIPLKSSEKEYTGNRAEKNTLSILGKNINLYLNNKISMEKYDKIKKTENLTLFNAVVLPVKISTSEYVEFQKKEIIIDEETAKDIAISKINGIIESRFENDKDIVEIKSKNFYGGEIKDDYYYMKCEVECIENIAKEVPFNTNIQTEK